MLQGLSRAPFLSLRISCTITILKRIVGQTKLLSDGKERVLIRVSGTRLPTSSRMEVRLPGAVPSGLPINDTRLKSVQIAK